MLSYLFKSNVDSSWKTWARENTVRVFFFRLPCIPPPPPLLPFPGDPDRSPFVNEALSSSARSAFSSSESSSFSRYAVEWEVGERFPVTLIAGDVLCSLRLFEVFSIGVTLVIVNNIDPVWIWLVLLPIFWLLSIETECCGWWWLGQGQGGQMAPYLSAIASHCDKKPSLCDGQM